MKCFTLITPVVFIKAHELLICVWRFVWLNLLLSWEMALLVDDTSLKELTNHLLITGLKIMKFSLTLQNAS